MDPERPNECSDRGCEQAWELTVEHVVEARTPHSRGAQHPGQVLAFEYEFEITCIGVHACVLSVGRSRRWTCH